MSHAHAPCPLHVIAWIVGAFILVPVVYAAARRLQDHRPALHQPLRPARPVGTGELHRRARRGRRSGGSCGTARSSRWPPTVLVGRAVGAGGLRLRQVRLPGPGAAVHALRDRADVPVRGGDPAALRPAAHASACWTTRSGVILPQAAFGLPLTIIILRGFFREHPRRDRGGGHPRRLQPLRLLLAHPAADGPARAGHRLGPGDRRQLEQLHAAAGGLQRRAGWTLPLGIQQFQGQYSSDTARILAYLVLAMVPALGLLRRRRAPPDRRPHRGRHERMTMLHVSGTRLRHRRRHAGTATRGGTGRLDEHGELHHRLSRPTSRPCARPYARCWARSGPQLFFERLLPPSSPTQDAALLAGLGMNCVRIPVNYRHFESDDRPFEVIEQGFRHLDRVIDLLGAQGMYSVIDLHALPGCAEPALALRQPHPRRRLLAASALPGPGRPPVGGHRRPLPRPPVGGRVQPGQRARRPERQGGRAVLRPAGEGGARRRPAARALPRRQHLLHGLLRSSGRCTRTPSSSATTTPWPGSPHGGPYPGYTRGEWCDRGELERTFAKRSSFQRETGTPLWVGEFGPVYTGRPERRRAALPDPARPARHLRRS